MTTPGWRTGVSQEMSLQVAAVPETRGKELHRGPAEPSQAQGHQPAPRDTANQRGCQPRTPRSLTPAGLGFRGRHAEAQGVLASRAPRRNCKHAWKGQRPRTPPPSPCGTRGQMAPGRPKEQGTLRSHLHCLGGRKASPRGGLHSRHTCSVAMRADVPATVSQVHTRSLPKAPPSSPDPRVPGHGCRAGLSLRGHVPCLTCVPLLSSRNLLGFGPAGTPQVIPPLHLAREDPTSEEAPL